MNLIKKYFTKEGRLYLAEQKLKTSINQHLQAKIDTQFCLLFTKLAKQKKWLRLSEIIVNYHKKTTGISALSSSVINKSIKGLAENGYLNSALLLCIHFKLHHQSIDLFSRSSNYDGLFSYLRENNLLIKKDIAFSIKKWEEHNGLISPNTPFATILERISQQNESLIPDIAHLKESIGKYEQAALLYKEKKAFKKAGKCYELANMLEEAMVLFKEIDDKESISIVAEKLGDYEQALQYVIQPERKFNLLILTERLTEAKSFAYGLNPCDKFLSIVKEKASHLVEKKIAENDYVSALECFMLTDENEPKKNDILAKGRSYYLHKQLNSSDEELIQRCIKQRIALEEKTGNYHIAGNLAEEELKNIDLAITLYEKANLFHKAIELTSKNLTTENSIALKTKLAELHSKGGNLLKAAGLYESIEAYEQAFKLYYQIPNFEKAIECYEKMPDQDEKTLIDLYKATAKFDEIINIYVNKNTFEALKKALDVAKGCNDIVAIQRIEKKLTSFKTVPNADLEKIYSKIIKDITNRYSKIVGIDFGTTTSVCAIYNLKSCKIEVVSNKKGYYYVDSFFAVNKEGRYLFGEQAKLLRLTEPNLVVSRVKRFLGEDKIYTINGKKYTTEEIIAHQLTHLKNNINNYIKSKAKEVFSNTIKTKYRNTSIDIIDDFFRQKTIDIVKDVVLSVPAYFNDSQKRSTKDAAEIAGLNVRRLLHEPTAAAVAFEHQKKYEGKIAVLDLGGGTFDISVLDINEGVFDVDKIGGNTKLGGSDIDNLLFTFFQKEIKKNSGIDLMDKNYDTEASRLKDACEHLKINLSTHDKFTLELPHFLGEPSYSFELSRKQLEDICKSFLNRYTETLTDTISNQISSIHHFILVGNATKMPAIVDLSTKILRAKQLKGIDPGLVVASGAAIDGAILANDIKDKLILDVVPFSLGISVLNKDNNQQQINRIIENNTTIPVSKTETYTTKDDYQSGVSILIYQGESENPTANHFLGRFDLAGILSAKAGVPKIEVSFDISADCILTVTAKDTTTKKTKSIKITGAVRLSYTEKQNLINKFKNKSSAQIIERKLKKIEEKIEQASSDFNNSTGYFKQIKSKLFLLIEEKLQKNPENYSANADQLKIINTIFIEKEQIFTDNQKNIDRHASIMSSFKNLISQHFDYTSATIRDQLQERTIILNQFLKNLTNLNQSYQDTVINKVSTWVLTLENMIPNIENMTLVQKAHYFITIDNIKEAIALLERNFNDNCTDLAYLETLLSCYKNAGYIKKYKDFVYDNRIILENTIPDFNHLNEYIKKISDSVFLIEMYDNNDNRIGNGSGFCIAENLIITNRHVVEGRDRIKIIGKDNTYTPTNIQLDKQNDIAVLRVDQSLNKLRIGASEFIEPGEKVIAIGFPSAKTDSFSENLYVSKGIVNSIRKHETSSERVIFIDNKIGRGMSGGPIINDIGEVVGITTFIGYSVQNDNHGMQQFDFQPVALPIHLALDLIK